MSTIASQITGVQIVTQSFVQAQFKENIKAPRHRPLWGEFIGDRWIIFPFLDVIMKTDDIRTMRQYVYFKEYILYLIDKIWQAQCGIRGNH